MARSCRKASKTIPVRLAVAMIAYGSLERKHVLNCGARFAAIRIATSSQRFQIVRFESQGQELFESLVRDYSFRGPRTHPKSPNTKKTSRLHKHFRKVRRTFARFRVTRVRVSNGRNCSEKLVQMNFFILGEFFRVQFPPLILLTFKIGFNSRASTRWRFRIVPSVIGSARFQDI